MAQSVGDLTVDLDVNTAKFNEQVSRVRQQLMGIGTAANDTGNKAVQAFSKQELAAKRAGMSVGQYSNAMRMLPAQFTDIATQLAGGQSPFLILMQQGGQIKDVFGGIGPAIKGVGTYVAGLINPVTLAAGAVGLLTYAVYNNRKEIDAAAKIAQSSLGVSGDAAQKLALNMVAISDKTGDAIDDVAKMFITTSDGASEAINKLLSVGYSYDDAKQKVESYKTSSNFTALNADIDQHRREVLKIGDAWTDAATKVKNYYTAADKGKQSVALGGAVDPIIGILEQAKDLQKTVNDLRIAGNLEVKKSVDWINKEHLAADRVAAAENRLKEAREQARKISASGDTEAISTANKLIAAREKEVEEARKQADKKPKVTSVSAGDRAIDSTNVETLSLQAQLSVLKQHTGINDTISQQRKKLWEMQAKFSVLEDASLNRTLSKEEQSLLANKDKALAQAEINAKLGDQIVAQERLNKLQDSSQKYVTQMLEKTAAMKDSAGLSSRESQRMLEVAQLQQGWLNQGGNLSDSGLQAELEVLRKYYAKQDSLRADWQAGAKSAWAEYVDAATNAYSQVQQVGLSALNGLSSQLAQVLTSGKSNFKEFTKSILSMLTEILVKASLVRGINSASSALGFGSLIPNAKGGVYSSASLSSFSGQIVDKPTLFAFAKGAGLMGEAGPEAIMPLTRNANGVLGVRAVGSVGGGAPTVNINIASDGSVSQSSTAGWEQFGSEIGSFVEQKYRSLRDKDLRQGGVLNRAMTGRR